MENELSPIVPANEAPAPRLIGRRRVLRDIGLVAAGGVGLGAALPTATALAAATAVTAINVRDAPYSAKGDGSTDDRAAIQAALNAVPTNGGAVFFPPGDYVVSGPLAPKSRTLLYGTHTPEWTGSTNPTAATKVRVRSGFSGTGLVVMPAGVVAVTFRNLALVGAGVGSGVHGIRLHPSTGNGSFCFEDLTIAGFTGSGLFGRLQVANLVNCFIHGNTRWGVEASGGEGWFDVHAVNCFLFYNRSGNLYFGGSGFSGAVDFASCRFERAGTNPANVASPLNPAAPGVRIASGRLITFTGCTTDANCGNGFEFVHEADTPSYLPANITLTNCRFTRDGTGTGGSLGEYAGLKVRGSATDDPTKRVGQIKAVNCMVLEGKASDTGSGTIVGPRYGVWYENTDHFQWIGGNIVTGGGVAYYVGVPPVVTPQREINYRPVLFDIERGLTTLSVQRPAEALSPPQGSTYLDAGASRLYVRVGTAWKSTLLS